MLKTYFTLLLEKHWWFIFLGSWLFYLVGLFMYSQFVWDSATYALGFKGDNFDIYLSNIRRIDYLRYTLSPLWVAGTSAVIWMLLKLGLRIANINIKALLLFKIILVGFVILTLPFWIKSVWLILVQGNYKPDDVKYFFPGSIVPFIDISGMNEVTIDALAHINVYHLGFIFFTAWQIAENAKFRFFRSLVLVLSTYGLGVVILRCLILMFAR
ncbi:MAG: hypothetical protein ACYC25_07755 [Paludibacter sp.]